MEWFNTVSRILNTLVTVGCQLERTPSPSAATPWKLIVEAATAASTVELTNTTPLKDAAAAVVGTDTKAAHGDHVHPLAVDDATMPLPDIGTGLAGVIAFYARRDHRHPLNIDTTVPPADSGTGSVGSASTYPRRDHAHPLNVDGTVPASVGMANGTGSAGTYARRDHVHMDRPPSAVGSPVNFAFTDENGNANSGASWVAGGTYGVTVSIVTRVRYNEADATPVITCFYRNFTFDVWGKLYSISTEGWYVVDAPVTFTV